MDSTPAISAMWALSYSDVVDLHKPLVLTREHLSNATNEIKEWIIELTGDILAGLSPSILLNPQHANTIKWRCTKIDDNRCTSKVTPLLAEPLGCTVSYRYASDHLYLGRLPAGRGVRSWRWVISRLEARSTLPGAACSMSQEPYDLT